MRSIVARKRPASKSCCRWKTRATAAAASRVAISKGIYGRSAATTLGQAPDVGDVGVLRREPNELDWRAMRHAMHSPGARNHVFEALDRARPSDFALRRA